LNYQKIKKNIKDNKLHGYNLASKETRLIAHLTKGIIYLIFMLGIYFILGYPIRALFNSDFELSEIGYSAIFGLIVGAIFYPLFTGNLGHKIFGLKVISSETGEDYKKSNEGAIRELLKNVLAYLVIPIIWILWDEKNQNLYDKLTKTYVVENKTDINSSDT
jgi:uncharacterized RDD family membrane protein YckC